MKSGPFRSPLLVLSDSLFVLKSSRQLALAVMAKASLEF